MRNRTSDLRIRNPEETQEKQGDSDAPQQWHQQSGLNASQNIEFSDPRFSPLATLFSSASADQQQAILDLAEGILTNAPESHETRSEAQHRLNLDDQT